MDDQVFQINLERSRIYWDYYRSMFVVFSFTLIAGMVCTALIYTKGEINLTIAVGIMLLLFLCIIFLAALMSLTIWRHENKHLDEILVEKEDIEEPPRGTTLV